MLLEMRSICKDYPQGKDVVHILKNISLEIDDGDYLAIMGPSGSGKTTLMNIIGCLDTPTSGTYVLAGEDVSSASDDRLADIRNQMIGFVFQSFYLLPKLTDITRPRMGQQCLTGFRIEPSHATFQFIVGNLTEELRQRHDVLLTVTQGRNSYLEVVQTVQQILSETFFNDRFLQILVGGGDDADIEALVRLVTYRAVSPFLYGTE